jgi:hypothetical protein
MVDLGQKRRKQFLLFYFLKRTYNDSIKKSAEIISGFLFV